MKKIMYFKLPLCPYCIQTNRWIKDIIKNNPEYKNIELKVIDEIKHRKLAYQYDYYLVPSFYVDGKKMHEGIASKSIVEEIFKKAYEG